MKLFLIMIYGGKHAFKPIFQIQKQRLTRSLSIYVIPAIHTIPGMAITNALHFTANFKTAKPVVGKAVLPPLMSRLMLGTKSKCLPYRTSLIIFVRDTQDQTVIIDPHTPYFLHV